MKKYQIKIGNELIDVREEVYNTYYIMKSHEKYLEKISSKNSLSYDQLEEQEYPIEEKMFSPEISVEDIVIKKIMLEKVRLAIGILTDYERVVINELFFKGKSERELAGFLEIPRTTLQAHKNKIMNKIKKIIRF